MYPRSPTVDAVVFVSIVLSFATLVTVHVALAAALVRRRPWWHGLLALVVPPLAPLFAYEEKLRKGALLWVVALFVYAAALAAGFVTSGTAASP
jgi:hypothetical protein